MKRFLVLAFAASAFAVPASVASAECDDLPVNAACDNDGTHCDVYKRPHPRLGRELCVRVTP